MAKIVMLNVALGLAVLALAATPAVAAHRPPWNVPPTDEIEVLDPSADPLGRPAVELRQTLDGLQVEIPPTVLVHKYYYTGDRSFQAQILPGGPSILVVNHPKTGERCYIPAQMLPGAPRVTYTSSCIEYDYGANGITLHFGLFGKPSIKYRSGQPWSRKLSDAVHLEQCKQVADKVALSCKATASASGTALHVLAINGSEAVQMAALPVRNALRMLPFGAAVFDPDLRVKWEEKIAEHQRDQEVERAARLREREDLTIRTNR